MSKRIFRYDDSFMVFWVFEVFWSFLIFSFLALAPLFESVGIFVNTQSCRAYNSLQVLHLTFLPKMYIKGVKEFWSFLIFTFLALGPLFEGLENFVELQSCRSWNFLQIVYVTFLPKMNNKGVIWFWSFLIFTFLALMALYVG